MTIAILYQHANFGGESLVMIYDDPSLSNNTLDTSSWNDQVSSIQVLDGTITVYEHDNYSGDSYVLGEGQYTQVGNLWSDQISSVDIWNV